MEPPEKHPSEEKAHHCYDAFAAQLKSCLVTKRMCKSTGKSAALVVAHELIVRRGSVIICKTPAVGPTAFGWLVERSGFPTFLFGYTKAWQPGTVPPVAH
jgi:hypothetical protein